MSWLWACNGYGLETYLETGGFNTRLIFELNVKVPNRLGGVSHSIFLDFRMDFISDGSLVRDGVNDASTLGFHLGWS